MHSPGEHPVLIPGPREGGNPHPHPHPNPHPRPKPKPKPKPNPNQVQAFEMLARGEGGAAASEGARVGTAEPYDERTPVYKTPLALRAAYKMDGGNSHSSSSWKQARARA